MIVLSGALVLVALVLLVFGALDRNLPYVYGSIGVSLLSLLLLLVGILQRRGELAGEEQDDATTPVTETTDQRVPALAGAGAGAQAASAPVTAALPVHEAQPVSRRVVPDAAPPEEVVADDDAEDDRDVEDGDAEDGAFEDGDVEDGAFEDGDVEDEDEEPVGSGISVLVVSGRPRYHLDGCRVLRGKQAQPLDRDDARMHGFTPCGVCKPDADETAPAAQPDSAAAASDDESFTETLFGGPLFADNPPAADPERHDERVETSALPSRPVQPVLAEVDSPAEREPDVADLRGDDPADDPALEADDTPVAPVPDVAGDPDELPELPAAEASVEDVSAPEPAVVEPAVVEAPVLEPVAEDVAPEPDVEDAAPEAAVAEAAPVRARRAARRAPAVEQELTVDDPAEAPVATPAAKRTPAAKKAPAKGTPAAGRAPVKKAPARKAPAKKAPAKRPMAEKAPAAPPVEPPAAPKRPLVRAVRADALRLGAPSAGSTTTRVAVRAAAPAGAPPVVVVPDRDRFHRPDCRYVRGVAGATTLPKASATRQGYAACGVCKP